MLKKVEHPLQGASIEIEEIEELRFDSGEKPQFLVTAWGPKETPGGALCGCAHFGWSDVANAFTVNTSIDQHETFNDALHAGITKALVRLYENQIAATMEGAPNAKS